MNIDNYTDYTPNILDNIAYNLYYNDCYENKPYYGDPDHVSYFISYKHDFLEYYEKAKQKIRKHKLIQIENKNGHK